MALPSVDISRKKGGIGRPLPNNDHISALVFWIDTSGGDSYPSGFSASDNMQKFQTIQEVQDAGITSDSNVYDEHHYHASEFFRLNPKGTLWIGILDNTTSDYTQIKDLAIEANGEIRQMLVYDVKTTAADSQITDLQTEIKKIADNHRPLSTLLALDYSGVASGDMDTQTDLKTLNESNRVSVVVGQDGAARGSTLFNSKSHSITNGGAVLGALSAAAVHESIAWVGKFNISDGTENEVPALANGDLLTVYSEGEQDTINDNKYIFTRKFVGKTGSFINLDHTVAPTTSDFAFISDVRTMDKSVRRVRDRLLDHLNSPINVNSDGTLRDDTLEFFKSEGNAALDSMVADGELDAKQILIDSTQDVVSTGNLEVSIEIIKPTTGKKISVKIGFTTNLS